MRENGEEERGGRGGRKRGEGERGLKEEGVSRKRHVPSPSSLRYSALPAIPWNVVKLKTNDIPSLIKSQSERPCKWMNKALYKCFRALFVFYYEQ